MRLQTLVHLRRASRSPSAHRALTGTSLTSASSTGATAGERTIVADVFLVLDGPQARAYSERRPFKRATG